MEHHTTQKGKIGEAKVLLKATKKGIIVSEPYPEAVPYDLVFDTGDSLDKVQVKYVESDGEVVKLELRSHACGHERSYEGLVDYVICYDAAKDNCFKIDKLENTTFNIRYTTPKNNQKKGINWFEDYIW